MFKRMLALLLCIFLISGMILPAYAEEIYEEGEIPSGSLRISSTEDFLRFAEDCRLDSYSENLEVCLENDIDLRGYTVEAIPVFKGKFDGNGHRITGLNISCDGSVQGLFRYIMTGAVVQNLTVHGIVVPGGSKNEAGSIAGVNEGSIFNCTFSGTVSGADYIGGLVGRNGVSGVIENCSVEGEIHGNHFVGGIAGENCGVIRNCVNTASINTTPQQNKVEISDITLKNLTDTEDVNTVTDIGGIAGISSGVIRESENRADVGYPHMGYNIGGIVGTQNGYVVDCVNRGSIQGRKEVGGIVGQLEPVSLIEYTEDALQILREQLNTMSGLVNRASGNAQSNAGGITGQIAVLQDHAKSARNAVETLFPNEENGAVPDADTILSAKNTLTDSLTAMPGTLQNIVSATEGTIYSLTRDLNAISDQLGAMGQTLNQAADKVGGTISDVSDLDNPQQLSAKIASCDNHGDVLADINAGGIAGAIAMENDLDILEDWTQSGESSMNFHAQIRAVIISCSNIGRITVRKQNAGGITGWQSLGLIKESCNLGVVDGGDGSYIGGIAGMSTGFIRSDYAKCEIYGKTYVGGISGSGTVVTDCISQTKIQCAREKQGAVLGGMEDAVTDTENPIAGNYYLPVMNDMGAIDGISYAGLAEAVDLNTFLQLNHLPFAFRTVMVRFVFEDGTTKGISVAPGGSLKESKIPEVPEKNGSVGKWAGLEDSNLTNILFDLTFTAEYDPYIHTIQSVEVRENGLPVLLLEGEFSGNAVVSAEKHNDAIHMSESYGILESWQITMSEIGSTARFLLPDGLDGKRVELLRLEDGEWVEMPAERDGSYFLIPVTSEQMHIVLAEKDSKGLIYLGAAFIIIIVCLGTVIFRKRILRKSSAK